MAGLLKLALDRQAKAPVEFNGSASSLPPLYQTNTQGMRIQVVDFTDDPSEPYEVVDCSASELRVVISKLVTGQLGDAAENTLASALEAAWAWDAGEEAFVGEINLLTLELAAAIGAEASGDYILEINLITGGVPTTIFQGTVTVFGNADENGAVAPSIIEDAETAGIFTIQDGVGGVVVDNTRVSITGLALGGAPSAVYPWVECPADSGFIGCNFEVGSASADGFSVRLSGIPPNNNYKVRYRLTF